MTGTDASSSALLAYCRAGFERDLAEELAAACGARPAGPPAHAAYVLMPWPSQMDAIPRWRDLIFARQCVMTHEAPIALTARDRVGPIVAALRRELAKRNLTAVADCWVEHPDTNDGKVLSGTARAIAPLILARLAAEGLIDPQADHRAHALLTPPLTAWAGVSRIADANPWPLGIPRLRMPHDAPSRSTLKLAEAIHVFLGDAAERLLRPGMHAVDLGAAPGGWTWQLVQRGLRVTAVDNGALKASLAGHALVKHLRADGFRYRPTRSVEWLVCDMVERPIRVAELVAHWLAEGQARHAIFNLKLPMKKRLAEIERCADLMHDRLRGARRPLRLAVKHLYHDREEVTVWATLSPPLSAA